MYNPPSDNYNSPRGNPKSTFSIYYFDRRASSSIRPGLAQLLSQKGSLYSLLSLENIGNLNVLDVGCGLGTIIIDELIKRGLNPNNLHSLDPDPNNFADKNIPYPRKNIHIMQAHQMKFKNEFDLVISSFVLLENKSLWYGKNYYRFMKKIAQSLVPNGMYLTYEPFENLPKTIYIGQKKSRSPRLRIKDESWLKRVGFKLPKRIIIPETEIEKGYLTLFLKLKK